MTANKTNHHTSGRTGLLFGGEPIHPILVSFPIAYFTAAFATDFVYWQTAAATWENFSDWLITAGLIMAGIAIIALVIDLIGGKEIRTVSRLHAFGYVLAVLLSLLNAFVHSRDGYTAVVPTGLMLSGLVVTILLITGLAGRTSAFRNRVGVST
jgi:uncharacterized membrane protein